MIDRIEATYIGIGLTLRVFLFFQTTIRNYFEDSGEFVTPLNSWKRGKTEYENMKIDCVCVFFSDRRNLSTKT